jgi:hypothetical protein
MSAPDICTSLPQSFDRLFCVHIYPLPLDVCPFPQLSWHTNDGPHPSLVLASILGKELKVSSNYINDV